VNTAVVVFFALCAVSAGSYGVAALCSGLSFAVRSETTTGLVTSQKPTGKTASAIRSESGMTYQPIVRFVDRQGHPVDFRSTVGYCPPRHHPGQTVEVRYDPRRPTRAVIVGDKSLAMPAGFVALGVFFGLVAVVSFVVP
jgi:hypothetical protein